MVDNLPIEEYFKSCLKPEKCEDKYQ